MGGDLLEVWVVSNAGLPLFTWRPNFIEESINQALFSGFLMAIINMIETSTDQEIKAMTFGSSKLNIVVAKDAHLTLLIIGRTGLKAKDKNVRRALDEIGEVFLEVYGEILRSWNSETTIFSGFEEKITDYFVKK